MAVWNACSAARLQFLKNWHQQWVFIIMIVASNHLLWCITAQIAAAYRTFRPLLCIRAFQLAGILQVPTWLCRKKGPSSWFLLWVSIFTLALQSHCYNARCNHNRILEPHQAMPSAIRRGSFHQLPQKAICLLIFIRSSLWIVHAPIMKSLPVW